MDSKTCKLLADLNRGFYSAFADDFARTRRGWPPGFDLILSYLAPGANVLDLGCGNGRFAAFLAARGWRGGYLGVDNDPHLLGLARAAAPPWPGGDAAFSQADLLDPVWPKNISGTQPDCIVCLAVLHHIPGRRNRVRFLSGCAELLAADRLLVLSTWQFLGSGRLRSRILSWSTIELDSTDVEPGDYLISWGKEAAGRRYCAAIDAAELTALATEAGLALVDSFFSDGKEGNLNLYGVFEKRGA